MQTDVLHKKLTQESVEWKVSDSAVMQLSESWSKLGMNKIKCFYINIIPQYLVNIIKKEKNP